MRYNIAELLANKKLRASVAKLAEKKELDFEDGNGVFDLDFRGQTLRINNRCTYDKLCELGGEKLLKKLLKAENTCLSTDRNAANQGACPVRGSEHYFLRLNAGATKAFSSILNGIAAWAKVDKHFDLDLVCVSTAEDAEEEEASDLFDWANDSEVQWLYCGKSFGTSIGAPAARPMLVEKDGKPIFIHGDTGKEIFLLDIFRCGGMVTCEPLQADEDAPLMGYRYQAEENGKWGFISPRLACVTLPRFDGIQAADSLVAAWTEKDGDTMDMMVSLPVVQEGTGIEDHWLTFGCPEFRDVYTLYQPLRYATMEMCALENGLVAYLYRPSDSISIGLLWRGSVGAAQMWEVRYKKGFVDAGTPGEKIPATGLSMEKCLQLVQEQYTGLYATACLAEPEWNSNGTYIIRKDGYWALADLDVVEEPVLRHLHTPLAYTRMDQPENWRHDWVLLERFGKKGIYNWLKEEFVASCEYEEIDLEDGYYVLKRHGKARKLNSYGRWVEEAKPACPKCKTELVQGALYCYMCGVSLTEPKQEVQPAPLQETPKAEVRSEAKAEPKVEVKPEPVKEASKPVEPPKLASKPPVEVPTSVNFQEKYREAGSKSQMCRVYGRKDRGTLDVCLKIDDTEMDDTDPAHFLYAELKICRNENGRPGSVVSELAGMRAYALLKDGIVYENCGFIWFLHVSGEKRKLGVQDDVLTITPRGRDEVEIEYVKRCSIRRTEHRDTGNYMHEEEYAVYDVELGSVTMSLQEKTCEEAPVKPAIKVPTSKNFQQEFVTTGQGSRVANGRLIVIVKSDGEKIPGDHSPEQYMYETFSIKDLKTLQVVSGLSDLSAYALGDNGIFYAKNDEIWYLTTDGNRRKLGEQKNVIKLTNAGSGKLMVEYVESYCQTDWEEDMDSERYVFPVCFDGYDVHTKKLVLNY